ncbi:hypothetical protein, partial [Corynebacterium glyciniphilum]|uniref:hypothetical protein n=1 Tax=Corynebacterium glyciniphilum TaxID=1404244 RepID=UPI00164243BB
EGDTREGWVSEEIWDWVDMVGGMWEEFGCGEGVEGVGEMRDEVMEVVDGEGDGEEVVGEVEWGDGEDEGGEVGRKDVGMSEVRGWLEVVVGVQ